MDSTFFMPAEWQPHSRCWMAWPCNPSIWTNGLEAARRNFAQVIHAILEFEPVALLVRPVDRAEAYRLCGEQVEYWEYPLDDSWMRDFGPTFVVDKNGAVDGSGGLAGVDWRFNGWGKYPHANDQHVARHLLERLELPRIEAPLVLEGGAFHVDGEGTVLTTEQCLLHPNRNPDLGRDEIEALVLRHLGASRMIWLPRGIADDDTDGHIDEIACFVAPGVALALVGSDRDDIDYMPLQNNLSILRESTDARGRRLEVATVEQPEPVYKGRERLSQSYVNFYIANGGVVMPAFGDTRRDALARGVLGELFPRHKILQVPARELAYGGGNIHCITQQQPLPQGGTV
jgi:agmatine deiminase